jgi:hypothetical protein
VLSCSVAEGSTTSNCMLVWPIADTDQSKLLTSYALGKSNTEQTRTRFTASWHNQTMRMTAAARPAAATATRHSHAS